MENPNFAACEAINGDDPRFLFEKRKWQPREFWSLVSTVDGCTLPRDCAEE